MAEQNNAKVHHVVHSFPSSALHRDEFAKVVQVCGMPTYWRVPLFNCTPPTASGCVDGYKFMDFWKQ